MTDNPLVETVARAIAYAEGNAGDSGVWPKWSDYRDHATAALRAIEDAGWKVVKKEDG